MYTRFSGWLMERRLPSASVWKLRTDWQSVGEELPIDTSANERNWPLAALNFSLILPSLMSAMRSIAAVRQQWGRTTANDPKRTLVQLRVISSLGKLAQHHSCALTVDMSISGFDAIMPSAVSSG